MELELAGHKYRTGRIDARKQFSIFKRLAPILQELVTAVREISPDGAPPDTSSPEAQNAFLEKLSGPLAASFKQIDDDDSNYIIDVCLNVCERASGGGWAPLMRGGALMFDDLRYDLSTQLSLTFAVLRENLGNFFSSVQPDTSAPEAAQKQNS